MPEVDVAYNIGSPTRRWNFVYSKYLRVFDDAYIDDETLTRLLRATGGAWLGDLLRVEAPPDADALRIGSPTREGGDIKVYSDDLGHTSLYFDADLVEFHVVEAGYDPWVGAGICLYPSVGESWLGIGNRDWVDLIGFYGETPPYIEIDKFSIPRSMITLTARTDDVALEIGSWYYLREGGDIAVYRDTARNRQFYLDADAKENEDALELYGRLVVGVSNPVRIDGSVGTVNGVVVEAHRNRHEEGGADPITLQKLTDYSKLKRSVWLGVV